MSEPFGGSVYFQALDALNRHEMSQALKQIARKPLTRAQKAAIRERARAFFSEVEETQEKEARKCHR